MIFTRNPNGILFRSFSFFFMPFQDRFKFFSVVILFRRYLISLLVSVLPVNSSISFGLNSLVLTISHLVVLYLRPYEFDSDNNLEIAMSGIVLFAYGIPSTYNNNNNRKQRSTLTNKNKNNKPEQKHTKEVVVMS